MGGAGPAVTCPGTCALSIGCDAQSAVLHLLRGTLAPVFGSTSSGHQLRPSQEPPWHPGSALSGQCHSRGLLRSFPSPWGVEREMWAVGHAFVSATPEV